MKLVDEYIGHQRHAMKQKDVKYSDCAAADYNEFAFSIDASASLDITLPHRGTAGQGVRRNAAGEVSCSFNVDCSSYPRRQYSRERISESLLN